MLNSMLHNAQVLIIDDEKGIREGLKRILTKEGLTVDLAPNGEEGLKFGLLKEYDCYFIDLKMPDIDGIDVLKSIKKKFPEAVCIIMTAFGSISSAVEAIKIGAYSYITKPFLPEDILVLANQALEHRWYVLEARRLKEKQHENLLEIAYERTRLKSILNSINDGIIILNKDLELVLYNRKFVQLLNLNKPLMIGESVVGLLPENLENQLKQIILGGDEYIAFSEEIQTDSRDARIIMANSSPIFDEKNRLLGAVSVLRDITEMKKVEQVKNQFVNMVAHELKAPVAAIVGYLDMIIQRTLGEDLEAYDKFLKRSYKRAEALKNLINDLLNLSRMDAGTIKREIVEIDLKGLILEMAEFFEIEAREKNITISHQCPDKVILRADEEEIKRVISNLLSNAIKYNKENGTVHIHVSKEKENVEIKVSDNGIGMTESELEGLFQEFYRVKNKMTREIPGTGLGLSIVKRIVESYNGTISVASEFGKGTTFTILLPLGK
ncbi:MAG: response regulator [Calditrichia bacterium]